MFPRKYFRYGSVVILIFIGICIVVGCTQAIQPKAWVSIEKPPIKIVIVDNEKDITPETIDMLLQHTRRFQYQNYKFNENTNVGFTHNVDYNRVDNVAKSVEVK